MSVNDALGSLLKHCDVEGDQPPPQFDGRTLAPAGHYHVAIAGGGPAGTAAAIQLANTGLRVLLVDAGSSETFKIGEGLPASARGLLRELGVSDGALSVGHRVSYGAISAWGSEELHANDSMFQLHGQALQLDRAGFDELLCERASEAGADVFRRSRLNVRTRATAGPEEPYILRFRTSDHETEVRCDWLIDAGGRTARLARRLGARRQKHDALVAFYQLLAAEDTNDLLGSTLVEAVADGWWYSVLLPCGQRLVVFLSDGDLVDRQELRSGHSLWEKLGRTLHLRRLCERHRYAPAAPVRVTDAASSCLDRFSGPRWFAVGDAAASFDPLSSKGIAHALYTGTRAAQALLATLNGDARAVQRYDAHLKEIYRVYLEQLVETYAAERRWPTAPFWHRRNKPRRCFENESSSWTPQRAQ